MKTTLSKLNQFLFDNKIEYMVTGTLALDILGVLPHYEPRDIDIKVFNLTEEQAQKLQELQSLSGCANEGYEHSTMCYTFIVNGIKINAIVVKTAITYEGLLKMAVPMKFAGERGSYIIYVQKIFDALYDKMRLKRNKDREYMLNLIAKLAKL